MKASRFTGVNRGTFSKQNDFVLTGYPGVATVLETKDPGGATVLAGFTPDSSRCMPVSPGSTTVRPGIAPVVHGAVPETGGRVTVCAGGVPVLPDSPWFVPVYPGL